jgi:hypothetical protein
LTRKPGNNCTRYKLQRSIFPASTSELELFKVGAGLDNKALMSAMAGHILDEGEMIGIYER